MKSKERLADLSLIGVSFLWGAGFIAVQFAIQSGLPVSLIVALRFLIAGAVVFAIRPKVILAIKKQELITGVVAGVLLYLSFLSQTLGQASSGVSNAAFITAIYVVLVPFIIWIFKGHPPKLKMFVLVFTTLAGVFILTYQSGSSVISLGAGDFMLILCAVGFAAHIAYLGTKARDFNPISITFLQMATAGIMGLVVFLFMDTAKVAGADWKLGLTSVLYLGLISSAVCYFLQTWAQTITTPSKAAIMMSMESLFGSLFSILVGLEAFRINIPVGGLIIFASVVLSEADFKRRKTAISAMSDG